MAISIVGSGIVTGISNTGGNITLSLPTLLQGDVVYVMQDGWSATAMTTTGYTQLESKLNGNTGSTGTSTLHRKVMGATPDTTAVCTGTGSASNGLSAIAICLRGVDGTTQEDVAITFAAGFGANPPGAITTVTDGCLIVVFGGTDLNPGTITGPSGYSNQTTVIDAAGTFHGFCAMATKAQSTHGTETPGAWTTWSNNWSTAYTLAVRPAANTLHNQTVTVSCTTSVSFSKAVSHSVAVGCVTTTSFLKSIAKALSIHSTTATSFSRAVGKTFHVASTTATSWLKQAKKIVAVSGHTAVTRPTLAVSKKVPVSSVTTTTVKKFISRTLHVSSTTSTVVRKQVGKIVNVASTTATLVSAALRHIRRRVNLNVFRRM